MTTEKKMVIQVTRDKSACTEDVRGYVWWPEDAVLAYNAEEQEWWDMNCRHRGEPLDLAAMFFIRDAIDRDLEIGGRVLVEVRTI